jgi:CRP-like cAMP-binding protein
MVKFDKHDNNDCLTCKRRSGMFNLLSNEELQVIRENRITIHYGVGEIIQKQGTFMSHVISVNAGLVKLYLEGDNHSDTILRIVTPTNFIGGPGIYFDQLHHFTVSAMKKTTVCFIELNAFKNVLNKNTAFATEFMKDFSKNVVSVYNRLITISQKQLPGRMAYALLYLFEEVYGSKMATITVSKQDLADLSAISRDSAVKILRDFQHEGLIRYTNHEVEILNPETLRMIRSIS